MKAAAYDRTGGPDVFRYVDVPDPTLRPGGIILEIEAVGIQGGDLLHRAGGAMATTPHVVGYQAAGRVREVGADVTSLTVGQPVVATMGFGSHAELAAVPAAAVYAIPEGLSIDEAAGVPIEFGTADDCLFEFGHLRAGETVLVQAGAGGVGLAAIQLAKAAGAATVLATASSDERLERLSEFGLDHGINYVRDDVAKAVREHTDGRGVDLVVDPVGGSTLETSIQALGYRGRISWVGRAGREASPPEVWPLMEKNASLTGVFLGAEMGRDPARVRTMIEGLLGRAAAGELRVVVDRVFPLAEAAEAHTYIESRQAFGRVLCCARQRRRSSHRVRHGARSPAASTHSWRCGRSAPMVVSTPWPGSTIVVSGNVNSRESIERMIVSKSASSKLVLPGPPGNSVSPVNRSGVSRTWNEIDPGVWPGLWTASRRSRPTSMTSASSRKTS